MITARLRKHQDLVDDLDPEGIWEYLEHYGVLGPAVLVAIDKRATNRQRNSAILRHIEAQGSTAVALLVNALRQSWQLHLANFLDTEQRIRPSSSSNSYLSQERHRGQIIIRLETQALKILASIDGQKANSRDQTSQSESPAEPQHDNSTSDITDGAATSDITCVLPVNDVLATCDVQSGVADTEVVTSSCLLVRDDDAVKPRSWCCFCLFRKCQPKSRKNVSNKSQAGKPTQLQLGDTASTCSQPLLVQTFNNNNDKRQKNVAKQQKKAARQQMEQMKKAARQQMEQMKKAEKDEKKKMKDSKRNKKKLKLPSKYSNSNTGDDLHINHQLATTTATTLPMSDVTSGNDADINVAHFVRQVEHTDVASRIDRLQLSTSEHQHHPCNAAVVAAISTFNTHGSQKWDTDKWGSRNVQYNTKLDFVNFEVDQTDLSAPARQSTASLPRQSPISHARQSPLSQARQSPISLPRQSPVSQTKQSFILQLQQFPIPQAQQSPISQPQQSPISQPPQSPNPQPPQSPIPQAQQSPIPHAQQSPTSQAWQYDGKNYHEKSSQLYERIIQDLSTSIIKYMEQDRGMLVLDMASSDSAVFVKCICLTPSHLTCLLEDVQDGSLLAQLHHMLAQVDTAILDIEDVKLRICLDDKEVNIVQAELSA